MHVTVNPTASNVAHARRVCIGAATTPTRRNRRGINNEAELSASSLVDSDGAVRSHDGIAGTSRMMRA